MERSSTAPTSAVAEKEIAVIISGRFTVPKTSGPIQGSFYGRRGEIAISKSQASAVSHRLSLRLHPIEAQAAMNARIGN